MSRSTEKPAATTGTLRSAAVGAALAAVGALALSAPGWALSEPELRAVLSVMAGTTDERTRLAPPSPRDVTAERLRPAEAPPRAGDALALMRFHGISLKRLEAALAEIAIVMPYVNLRQSASDSVLRQLPREEREALAAYLERTRAVALESFPGNPRDFEETARLLGHYAADVNRQIMPRLEPIPLSEGGGR